MRKVYICSPYRAKDGAELDRNIDYAQQLTRQALEAGLAPITPHLYMTQCMDDKKLEERARGMAAGLALLKGCDFVIAGVKYGITEGMDREIHTANCTTFCMDTGTPPEMQPRGYGIFRRRHMGRYLP